MNIFDHKVPFANGRPCDDRFEIVSRDLLREIASCIRSKTGGRERLRVENMPNAIRSIQVGGTCAIKTDIPGNLVPIYMNVYSQDVEDESAFYDSAICQMLIIEPIRYDPINIYGEQPNIKAVNFIQAEDIVYGCGSVAPGNFVLFTVFRGESPMVGNTYQIQAGSSEVHYDMFRDENNVQWCSFMVPNAQSVSITIFPAILQ